MKALRARLRPRAVGRPGLATRVNRAPTFTNAFAVGVMAVSLVSLAYGFANGINEPGFWPQAALASTSLLLAFAAAAVLPNRVPARFRRALWPLAIGTVALTGFVLRWHGLDFGLPYVPHPDEPAVVNIAQGMLVTGDLNPHRFVYPSFFIYLQAFTYAGQLLWGFARGDYQSIADLPASTNIITTAPGIFLWGRALTVFLATGAILATYGAGKLLYGRRVGLLAALLLAFAPATIADAHLITVDVPAASFAALAFYWIVALYRAPLTDRDEFAWWPILRAGIGAGLATATKYNAAVIIVPLLLVPLLRSARAPWRVWLLALPGAALTFLAVTPFAVPDLPAFLDDTASVITHYKFVGHQGFEGSHNWLYYTEYLWRTAPLPFLLALGGLLLLAFRHRRSDLLVLPFPLLYFGGMSGLRVNFTRNLLPLDPFFALAGAVMLLAAARLAATGIDRIPHWRAGWPARRHARLALTGMLTFAVLSATLVQPAWSAARLDILRATPDSRIAAFRWMRDNLSAQSFWLVQLPSQQVFRQTNAVSSADFGPLSRYPPEWYPAHGFSYLLLNRAEYDRFMQEPARYPVEANWYRDAMERFSTVRIFPGGPGPELHLLDTRLSAVAMQTELDARFGAGDGVITLEGFNLGVAVPGQRLYFPDAPGALAPVLRPGQTLGLTILWRATGRPPGDYQLFVHLRNARGQTVAQRDTRPANNANPTNRWRPGQLILAGADLELPATLPPGRYRLIVGLYPPGNPRLPVRPAPGAPALPDDELPLATIEVAK